MIIQAFPSGPFSTNAYIVACPTTKRAAIIDPAPGCSDNINAFIKKHDLSPEKILITHSHWDHIADTAILKENYSIPVFIHTDDSENLKNPGFDQLPCWISITPTQPDHLLKEGDEVSVGDLLFEVIHTPGHSPGGVCFYCKNEGVLISGDTLFKGSMGNVSFPTSSPKLMWESLKKLSKLPSNTLVYPGHGPKTSIGAEPWIINPEKKFG